MRIYDAKRGLPWVIEGAAVSVSIVCFAADDDPLTTACTLDGNPVRAIRSDLRSADLPFDLRKLTRLPENRRIAFQGVKAAGMSADQEDTENPEEQGFVLDHNTAQGLLDTGGNPNGRPNSDVVRPYWSGEDVVGRPRDRYIIDFGPGSSEAEARQYAAPFAHLERIVRRRRTDNREGRAARRWWLHQRPRPEMRMAIAGLDRFLVTSEVAKYRFFRWAPPGVVPSGSLVVFARSDNIFMGILESHFHKLWVDETHNPLEDRPRYRIGDSFESFPFPDGLSPNLTAAEAARDAFAAGIGEAAEELNQSRENALVNATEPLDVTTLYDRCAEGMAAWLTAAHKKLDDTVAAAYGWPPDLDDETILARLGELNRSRAA